MKLKNLLKNVNVLALAADENLEVEGLTNDSRKVTPGYLFFAISGFTSDGNRFIPMALEKGAAVVVTAKKPEASVPYVLVDNDRLAMAVIAANYYGNPAQHMTMVGITGTNGKTSSTLLLKQVIESVTGEKVGLIGTMENMIGREILPTQRTTPESLELQELFAKMRAAGCKYVVMEVSSHAITLERVGGIHYHVGAFTNLTEDHLDFHKTMEAYCDAKAQLFRRCDKGVLNCDDQWYGSMAGNAACQILPISVKSGKGLHAENVHLYADGVSFTAVLDGEKEEVRLQIPGRFTVYNALTVLGCAVSLGISLRDAAAALAKARGVKGRVEVVPTPGKPYTVLIDYAHTPDGLENVLLSVKDFCKGKVIAVFGCGGDRDPIKRPIMGKIGVKLADFAVITSDNPRTEDPGAIIADIVKGVSPSDGAYIVIPDRRKAIRYAMDKAEKNDIIILAGKGHETYQEICGVKYHLDEREEVAAHLEETRE